MHWYIAAILILLSNSISNAENCSVKKDSALNFTNDSSFAKVRYYFRSSVSASYINYHNWKGNKQSAFTFLSNIDFRHRKSYPSGWTHNHFAKIELGFLYFNDSIWWKNADQVRLGLQWTEKPGKYLTHSYSFFIQSQLLRSWQFNYDNKNQQQIKTLKGWFMAPGVIELAYGLNWNFREVVRLNVAFATFRISSKPRLEFLNETLENDESLFKSKRRYIKTEYGFSAQLNINKELFPKVLLWDHQSRLFFNALNSTGVHADISNQFVLRFLKYLQFRVDTHILYEPDESKKLSYRQELLLGIVYELKY